MSPLIQIQKPHDGASALESIAAKLQPSNGPEFWSSLEELSGTEEFQKFIEDEFPDRVPDWKDKAKRRTFLKLMGSTLALAGVTACTKQPPEMIVPYVRDPEQIVPGKPLFYATARPVSGGSLGVLAESHMGRPTKVEGNPTHPASLGATDAFTQASILDLWDPDRAQSVSRNGQVSSWLNFIGAMVAAREEHASRQGAGLYILTQPFSSPTLGSQMDELLRAMPQARWHQWEPVTRVQGFEAVYNFANADVIVSLDADFLACGAASVRYSRDFAARRRAPIPAAAGTRAGADQHGREESRPEGAAAQAQPVQGQPVQQAPAAQQAPAGMNRLYVVEGTPSVTGGMADHRIRVRTSEVAAFAAELARGIGAGGAAGTGGAALSEKARAILPAVVRDLQDHRGRCVVVAGDYQPAAVHALARSMNQALGNVGSTVTYSGAVDFRPVDNIASIRELVGEMNAGRVQTLVIIGGNPVYDAPADLKFAEALRKVRLRAHLSMYFNETSGICQWHIPEAHYLESWSDTRAHDGTVTIIQPLIEPLYNGVTAHQVLSVLLNRSDATPYDIVREYWRARAGAGDFNAWWQQTLHDGVVPGTAGGGAASAPGAGSASAPAATAPAGSAAQAGNTPAIPQGELEIVFRPDPMIWDGQFANNSWLQETPKPQSKMTWDNAVWISPATAQRLSLATRDMVEIEHRGLKTTGPVWVMPGHADDSITLQLGFGRARAGRVGNRVGFDAYRIRTSDAPWVSGGVQLRKTGATYDFATPQRTMTMEGRHPVMVANVREFQQHPELDVHRIPDDLTLYPQYKYDGYKWGMAIDLNACVGCQACVVACQSENNIPVVGKDQVSRGRHMNWLRVDRYYRGSMDDPETYYQPIPCMHCETAPCEPVCPVAATVHSGDGLNQMVYNRCVGTRYCSNNCPYKVRRFNFYLYSDWYSESLHGLRNPDVSVRSRGVMEKCTYCVQRINSAKIESEKEDRRIVDGEILTACQQACPTEAIVFGDINDPNSRVARLKAEPRDYSLLEDLNTRPRTTYLARLRNPNPAIERG